MSEFPEVMTVAGTDSGGGAGMMADMKTFQACHVFSTNVIVGVTAQNTIGVKSAYPLPLKMIDDQFNAIAADYKIKAVKTGVLFNVDHVKTVIQNLNHYSFGKIVVDPVMVNRDGVRLFDDETIEVIVNQLIPIADVVTPNLPEAEIIVGHELNTTEDIESAAEQIQIKGSKNVIIKGGRLNSPDSSDFVRLSNGKSFWLNGKHVDSKRKHGTGDTLSAVITAELAKEKSVEESVKIGKKYLNIILQHEIKVGHENGPLNHWGSEGSSLKI